MIIVLSIIIGLGMSLTAIITTYLISHRSFFKEAYIILEKYRLTSKPRAKGELRKIRKVSSILRKARKRLILLFFIHLSIFLITYTTAIVLTGLLIPEDKQLIEIPIALPLFSAKTGNTYITHVLFITFIAYLAPNYLLIRAARPVAISNSR